MAYFDQLGKASFDGITFPVERVSIKGGLRDHVHEYPHTAGGAPEKLGRRLYTFRLTCTFDEGMIRAYPGLYPDNLEKLFALWEQEKSSALILPTLGAVTAYCFDWSKEMVWSLRSGERVELEFREDQSRLFLIDAMLAAAATALPDLDTAFQLEADTLDPKPSIFEAISDAVNAVRGVRDQADLASNLLESKLLAIAALCSEADRSVRELQDPLNYRILEALKQIWAAASQGVSDLAGRRSPLRSYTTPTRMSIADVSLRVFGSTDRSMEILQINSVEDAFDIPAGTTLKYYDEAA